MIKGTLGYFWYNNRCFKVIIINYVITLITFITTRLRFVDLVYTTTTIISSLSLLLLLLPLPLSLISQPNPLSQPFYKEIGGGKDQGRIHGNLVADSWAGAVMKKTLRIQKSDGPTDRQTDRHGKV